MDVPTLIEFLRPILTVTTVKNTEETGEKYVDPAHLFENPPYSEYILGKNPTTLLFLFSPSPSVTGSLPSFPGQSG